MNDASYNFSAEKTATDLSIYQWWLIPQTLNHYGHFSTNPSNLSYLSVAFDVQPVLDYTE